MPYPRYGEAGQSGGNSGRSQSFRGAPSPWQVAEQSTGLPSGADANPFALVGNLVGAMMGRMAAGGGGMTLSVPPEEPADSRLREGG